MLSTMSVGAFYLHCPVMLECVHAFMTKPTFKAHVFIYDTMSLKGGFAGSVSPCHFKAYISSSLIEVKECQGWYLNIRVSTGAHFHCNHKVDHSQLIFSTGHRLVSQDHKCLLKQDGEISLPYQPALSPDLHGAFVRMTRYKNSSRKPSTEHLRGFLGGFPDTETRVLMKQFQEQTTGQVSVVLQQVYTL